MLKATEGRKVFSYPIEEAIHDAELSKSLIDELDYLAARLVNQSDMDGAGIALYAANWIGKMMETATL